MRTNVVIMPILASSFWSFDDSLQDILVRIDKKSDIVI